MSRMTAAQKAEAFRKEGFAYRVALRDKSDARCRDIRIGRMRFISMRASEIPGIQSSQVLALLEIMAEELFTLRKEVSRLKGQEL